MVRQDHRGTPTAPGRVVTLIDHVHWKSLNDHHSHAPEKVWGAAYHFPVDKVSAVCSYLDIREVNGYSVQYTQFYAAAGAATRLSTNLIDEPPKFPSQYSNTTNCLVYIGLPENPQFVGAQDPESLAKHILRSSGPSGPNKDYLYALEEALMGLNGGGSGDGRALEESRDEHVSDLVEKCRRLEGAGEIEAKAEDMGKGDALKKVVSTNEEQEEVEKTM